MEREESGGQNVLVAESRAARIEEIRTHLLEKGYHAVSVADAPELLARIETAPPALLLIAENFVGGAGAVCAEIRARPAGATLPIIMIVESADSAAWRTAQAAGVDEFLTWPIDPGDLATRARRVIGLNLLSRLAGASDAAEPRPARTGKRYRLLVVEDDQDQRQLLRKRLESVGHAVRTASNGREALEAVTAEAPDVIISDVMMPEMNGFEFCRRLKQEAATRSIPVIMTTSMDDDESRRLGYEAGADDYVNKPVNVPELAVRIQTLARLRYSERPPDADADQAPDRPAEKSLREMNPLELWFHWQTRLAATPALADLRRRVSEEIGAFLEKRHDYKIGLFFESEIAGADLKKAYAEIRQATERRIREILREETIETRAMMTAHEQEMLLKGEIFDRFAFGPIQPLLDNPHITDILVGRYNDIHIEMKGSLLRTPIRFDSETHLRRIVDAILRYSGREINEMKPYVEARLRDGSRVSATIPPLSIDGTTLTIRKFVVRRMELDDLLRTGMLSVEMAGLLDLFVRAGANIIVSGSTGAGKTTLLNLLGSCIPFSERIITVEDTAELRLRHRDVIPELMKREERERHVPALNMERFEARESSLDGVSVTIRDIIRLALRKRPDRIVVGEVRGGEALDMLNAMNTGHRGCLTTIHANNTSDMMVRLENMVIEANAALPLSAVQRMIVAGINLAVQVVKFADNTRRITEITEVQRYDTDRNEIILRPLYIYSPGAADPFVLVHPPSPRLRGLVEEFLMKSGTFRSDWDAGTDETGARAVLKRLFHRSLAAFFETRLFEGAGVDERRARAEEAFDFLAEEVYRWDAVIEVRRDRIGPASETSRIHFADLADHRFLTKVRRAALRLMARRLHLPESVWRIVVAEEASDIGPWADIFPTPEGRGRTVSERDAVFPGQGVSVEDVRQAFFNVSGELRSRFAREGTEAFDAAGYRPRVERLAAIAPYLRLATLDAVAPDAERLLGAAGGARSSGEKFMAAPSAIGRRPPASGTA